MGCGPTPFRVFGSEREGEGSDSHKDICNACNGPRRVAYANESVCVYIYVYAYVCVLDRYRSSLTSKFFKFHARVFPSTLPGSIVE